MKNQIKICVTGGPSGGKTTLIEGLKKEFATQVAVIPEAASILYRGGFPRIKSENALCHTQRAIYFTQRELEGLIGDNSSARLLVCDRGSLDSAAYWPADEGDFLKIMHTTRDAELARYDWVFHLDTAPEEHYDTSNPVRLETFKEAETLNNRIKEAWRGHPQRVIIPQSHDFLAKMKLAVDLIHAISANQSLADVQKILSSVAK